MVIGSLGYVTNDAVVRWLTDDGLDVYQTLFLRGVAMTTILFGATVLVDARFSPRGTDRFVWARVGAEAVSTALFFAGLVQLDFANAQTILMLVPFGATVIGARVFGEPVSGRRYAAVIVGFIGVIAVMKPVPGEFSAWALVVAGSAGFQLIREVFTRRVPADAHPLPIAFLTAAGITTLTGVISIFSGWSTVTWRHVPLLLLACSLLIIGYWFSIQTVRVGDLSVSAPFRYSLLIGAVVIGVVVFDEALDAFTVIGCTLIVLAGVYASRLDRRTGGHR